MTCREKIMSEDFADILVDYPIDRISEVLGGSDFCYQPLEDELGVLYVNLAYVDRLSSSQYRYTYIPKCYGLLQTGAGDISYEQIGTLSAQRPPLSLTGKQVLIGLLDTGIRHTLDAFQRQDGTSRILSVWDQQAQSGEPPKGFLYGTEYLGNTNYREKLIHRYNRQTEVDQNEEQESEPGNGQPQSVNETDSGSFLEQISYNLDPIGHGTAVASAALNCAPDALVVMVKCKMAKNYLRRYYAIGENAYAYAESDLMSGVGYLKSISDALNLPMVICFTMGTNMGSHAAYSLLDRYLGEVGERRGSSIVIAGGNEGNQAHHFAAQIPAGSMNESASAFAEPYQEVEINVSPNTTGFYLELWGSLPAVYTISLRSPDGEQIRRIPIRYGQTQEFSFIYSSSFVRVDYILVERASAQQLIALRFEQPLEGIWTLQVYMENSFYDGVFHIWLPIAEFLNQPVSFLAPDPYETMTEPSYLDEAISLTYYDAATGSFAIDSGRGYRDGNKQFFQRQVPDLSAPGIEVDTAVGKRNGSSIAAALTAGCVAQFLEWAVTRGQDPLVSSKGVRNYFIRGCTREYNQSYPSPVWGYGKLSLTGVFDVLRG